VSNSEHPLYYRGVTGALDNQNYVVITGNRSCPTDSAASPATGKYTNVNTMVHQTDAAGGGGARSGTNSGGADGNGGFTAAEPAYSTTSAMRCCDPAPGCRAGGPGAGPASRPDAGKRRAGGRRRAAEAAQSRRRRRAMALGAALGPQRQAARYTARSMQSLWMLVAAALFAVLGAFVKLAPTATNRGIVLYRGLTGALALAAYAHFTQRPLGTPIPWVHFRRGAVGTAALSLWFFAASTLRSHGTALNYTSSLFLAAFILGAALRARRPVNVPLMLAVALGFAGVCWCCSRASAPGSGWAPPAGCSRAFFRRPPTGTCATSHGRASRNGGSSSTSRFR